MLGHEGQLWLLDADLGVVTERKAPPDPLALAVDPHGRYVLVSSRMSVNYFFNRYGKSAGRLETFERGIAWAKKAVAANNKKVEGHFWLAVLYGSFGETKGISSSSRPAGSTGHRHR